MTIDVCVYSSYQPLSASLLVSGCSVDLSCKEQVADLFCLQVMVKLCRIEEIIFDGISRTVDLYVPECRDLLQGTQLYL